MKINICNATLILILSTFSSGALANTTCLRDFSHMEEEYYENASKAVILSQEESKKHFGDKGKAWQATILSVSKELPYHIKDCKEYDLPIEELKELSAKFSEVSFIVPTNPNYSYNFLLISKIIDEKSELKIK